MRWRLPLWILLAGALMLGYWQGRDALVHAALALTSEGYELETLEGSLFGTLRARGLALRIAGTSISAADLALALDWPALLTGRVRLLQAELDDAVLVLPAGNADAPAAEPPAGYALPALPALSVSGVRIRDLTLHSGSSTTRIRQLGGAIELGPDALLLQDAALALEDFELRADGRIGTGKNGRLALRLALTVARQDVRIEANARVEGTLSALAVSLDLRAPTPARLRGSLAILPGPDVVLTDATVTLRLADTALAGRALTASWRSDLATLAGRWLVSGPEPDQQPLALSLAAELASMNTLTASVGVETPGGTLPIAVSARLYERSATLSTTLQAWAPAAGLDAIGSWTGSLSLPDVLSALRTSGTLTASIRDFADPRIELSTRGLELRSPQIDSRLDLDLTLAGGRPSGTATLRARDEHLTVTLDGETVDLTARADELGNLLPGARGEVDASGRVIMNTRSWRPLTIQLQGDAQRLGFGEFRLDRLAVSGAVGDTTDGSLDARLEGVRVPGWSRAITADVRAQGKLTAPNWRIVVTDGFLESELAGRAIGLDASPPEIELALLRIAAPDWGRWRLRSPVRISIGAAPVPQTPLCLDDDHAASLCIRHQSGAWALALADFAAFELQALMQREVPDWPDGLQLRGTLALDARAGPPGTSGVWPIAVESRWQDARFTPDDRVDAPEEIGLPVANASFAGRYDPGLALPPIEGRAALTLRADDGSTLSMTGIRDGDGTLAGQLNGSITDLEPLGLLAPSLGAIDGAAEVALSLSGSEAAPRIDGSARLAGTLLLAATDVQLRDIELEFSSDDDPVRPIAVRATAGAGDGSLELTGRTGWSAATGPAADLSLRASAMPFMNWRDISASGDASLRLQVGDSTRVSGSTEIHQARIHVRATPPADDVTLSDDVVIVDAEPGAGATTGPPISVDVRVRLQDDVLLTAGGLQTRIVGAIRLQQQPRLPPRVTGTLSAESGNYRFYGVDLELQRGRLDFDGAADNPAVSLQARRVLQDQSVGLEVGGRLQRLETRLTSDPPLPDNLALQWLLTGRAPGGESTGNPLERDKLADAAISLGLGATGAVTRLRDALQLDELRLRDTLNTGTVLMGRRINDRLYVSYEFGLLNRVGGMTLRYQLTNSLSLQSEVGDARGIELMFDRRFDRLGWGDDQDGAAAGTQR